MYEQSCPHGYIPDTCAECRRAQYGEHTEIVSPVGAPPDSAQLLERYSERHRGKSRADLDARRSECVTRAAELKGYEHLSQPQRDEADALAAEMLALDEFIMEDDVRIRSEKIEYIKRVAQDPANLEGPVTFPGIPALVKKLGDRRETAAETLQRMRSNPWATPDGGPLAGHTTYGGVGRETASGFISRAHVALEGLEATLTRDGCGKLAEAMAEESTWPGVMVKRSKDEQAEAARLWLALSNPHYADAFRSVLRYPAEFMGAGGTGFETLTDEQRQAWRDVRTNEACRAAFAEASGAAGAFAIPLDLHPDIILTNAGSANPFRKLARTVVSTTNVAQFVTSAGSTANWLPEGTAVADTTPTLGQLSITHYKESVWIYGSFEVLQDTALSTQVPALIADAKDRLEVVAFTTGTGSAQPFGIITHGTSDATVGVLTAAMVYGLHNSLPPRFRVGDNAKPVWLANVTIMNALRQIPAFAGAVNPILADGTNDSIPEVLGIDIYEDSAMDPLNTVSGHKNLALLDMNSFIITLRQPELLLYEPLFKDQATGRPSGQAGWFSWSRVGSDLTTATACQYHTT
jgi:HK97 family phage major capsid protein